MVELSDEPVVRLANNGTFVSVPSFSAFIRQFRMSTMVRPSDSYGMIRAPRTGSQVAEVADMYSVEEQYVLSRRAIQLSTNR